MKKLTKKERQELIDEIMNDVVENIYNYKDFLLDCAKDCVERWNDEDLRRWCYPDEDV